MKEIRLLMELHIRQGVLDTLRLEKEELVGKLFFPTMLLALLIISRFAGWIADNTAIMLCAIALFIFREEISYLARIFFLIRKIYVGQEKVVELQAAMNAKSVGLIEVTYAPRRRG